MLIIEFTLLFTWMTLGVLSVLVRTSGSEDRRGWLPVAAILGPFWLVIAGEQRQTSPIIELDTSNDEPWATWSLDEAVTIELPASVVPARVAS